MLCMRKQCHGNSVELTAIDTEELSRGLWQGEVSIGAFVARNNALTRQGALGLSRP